MYLVVSVCPSVRLSVRPSVNTITAEPFRGSALPSAAKEQRRVIISPGCLSVCRIVARMRSIGFYNTCNSFMVLSGSKKD